ncbi:MAG: TauD/TfdA family dioxygenase, partial [Acidobacteriota bacterium]
MREITGPSVWRSGELAARTDWQYRLSAQDTAELERALEAVLEAGLPMEQIKKEDFPLPTLGARLADVQHALEHGSGSFFLRGWPSQRFSRQDNAVLFWGVSRHLGTPISQSAKGEHLFPVQDAGFKMGDAKARGPNTSKGLNFHCDRCDVIGFLCINQARSGGENYLVSSPAVHNEILKRRPDLREELYNPFYYTTHNVDTATSDPWCHQPIFAAVDGQFVGYVLRVLIDRAYELPELPDMTDRQREALDLIDAVCAEPSMHYELRQEPGDMLFINNFINFHSRSAFEDHAEPERKRLLYRIW